MKPNDEIKRQAMSAIAAVKSLAPIGMVNLAAGAAVYTAHIRQMDRQTQIKPQIRRDAVGREV